MNCLLLYSLFPPKKGEVMQIDSEVTFNSTGYWLWANGTPKGTLPEPNWVDWKLEIVSSSDKLLTDFVTKSFLSDFFKLCLFQSNIFTLDPHSNRLSIPTNSINQNPTPNKRSNQILKQNASFSGSSRVQNQHLCPDWIGELQKTRDGPLQLKSTRNVTKFRLINLAPIRGSFVFFLFGLSLTDYVFPQRGFPRPRFWLTLVGALRWQWFWGAFRLKKKCFQGYRDVGVELADCWFDVWWNVIEKGYDWFT